MLRDRFKNNRKPVPPASPGGSLSGRQPSAAGSAGQPNYPQNAGSAAAGRWSDAGLDGVLRGNIVPEATTSSEAAGYADELKRQWEASFHKSRTGSPETGGPEAASAALFKAGQIFNGIYEIEAALSQGGMGCVYRALHLIKQQPVILKVMLQDRTPEDPAFIKFVQECKIAMTIAHPNVVTVYDWGILTDTLIPYLVMEYLPGQSLRELLCALKTVPLHEAAALLAQACIGLDHVHREDIIHRDLKPENLMVQLEDDGSPEGRMSVKILDFGIAQLHEGVDFTDGGQAVGTLNYMSPEQVQAKPVDLRTDIYAMGIVFYEMITGRVPFKGKNGWQTMSMHVFDTHIPASQLVSIPHADAVDALIQRCLSKDREGRYGSALELAGDLQALAAAEEQ